MDCIILENRIEIQFKHLAKILEALYNKSYSGRTLVNNSKDKLFLLFCNLYKVCKLHFQKNKENQNDQVNMMLISHVQEMNYHVQRYLHFYDKNKIDPCQSYFFESIKKIIDVAIQDINYRLIAFCS